MIIPPASTMAEMTGSKISRFTDSSHLNITMRMASVVLSWSKPDTPLCTAAEATKDLEIARDFLRLQQKGAGIKLSF